MVMSVKVVMYIMSKYLYDSHSNVSSAMRRRLQTKEEEMHKTFISDNFCTNRFINIFGVKIRLHLQKFAPHSSHNVNFCVCAEICVNATTHTFMC